MTEIERHLHNRRIIIVAGGKGERWKNYLDIPKHFVKVEDDEPIIQRTIRQSHQHGAKEIYVVANDNRYKLANSILYKPTHNEANTEADKLLNSSELWNEEGRTIIMFGDVYFTHLAMDRIMSFDSHDFWVFGRAFESQITGKPWGEIFAFSFYPEHIPEVKNAFRRIKRLYEWGMLDRTAGWALYRAMINLPDEAMNTHLVGPQFTNIDDWTEDFDYPDDHTRFFELWEKNNKPAKKKEKNANNTTS